MTDDRRTTHARRTLGNVHLKSCTKSVMIRRSNSKIRECNGEIERVVKFQNDAVVQLQAVIFAYLIYWEVSCYIQYRFPVCQLYKVTKSPVHWRDVTFGYVIYWSVALLSYILNTDSLRSHIFATRFAKFAFSNFAKYPCPYFGIF